MRIANTEPCHDKAVKLIRREPDAVIADMVAGWPRRFDAKRALARSPQMRRRTRQAEPCEPIGYFLVAQARLNFGLVDPLDGRFYPIDRLARNRLKRRAGP
jgi:hypothetical protein